jgi:predicted enzyme related to lactoylglutathione lyase
VIKEIAFSAYPAADVRKLHGFYTEVVGVDLGEPMEFDGKAGYAEGKVGDGYFALLLDEWLRSVPRAAARASCSKWTISTAEIARLKEHGVECSEPMILPVCKLANFSDPEAS